MQTRKHLAHNRRPVDNDHDGKADEDGPDDLNGDGINQMWKADPSGSWIRIAKTRACSRRVARARR